MGTIWVLDTETKGTGANMVPLERVSKRTSAPVRRYVMPERREPEDEPRKPRAPRRFRIVDVMTRETVVQDASAREAIEALAAVRSSVDVNVYVWHEERGRWILLPFGEQSALMELARKRPAAS